MRLQGERFRISESGFRIGGAGNTAGAGETAPPAARTCSAWPSRPTCPCAKQSPSSARGMLRQRVGRTSPVGPEYPTPHAIGLPGLCPCGAREPTDISGRTLPHPASACGSHDGPDRGRAERVESVENQAHLSQLAISDFDRGHRSSTIEHRFRKAVPETRKSRPPQYLPPAAPAPSAPLQRAAENPENAASPAPMPPDVAPLAAAWPHLPQAVKAGIAAMVSAASQR